MEKWQSAAEKFLDSCNFKDEIEAVFLTGSHVSGNADEFSDIDLYIVINDDANWRERGNKRIDGLCIEYFVNPMRQIKKYIDDSYSNVQVLEITMILSGIVIFNKNSTAEKMIDYCKTKIMSDFPPMSEFSVYTGLYRLWDNLDELKRACTRQTPDIAMQFYNFIQHAFELYSQYICSPVPGYHKLYRWLTDDNYAKRYGLAAYNDPVFLQKIKAAYGCTNSVAMLDLSKDVYEYVTNEMGGFDVNNFVMRGPCN